MPRRCRAKSEIFFEYLYITKYLRLTTNCDVRLSQEPHTRTGLSPIRQPLRRGAADSDPEELPVAVASAEFPE
jgi:hypothetical protein